MFSPNKELVASNVSYISVVDLTVQADRPISNIIKVNIFFIPFPILKSKNCHFTKDLPFRYVYLSFNPVHLASPVSFNKIGEDSALQYTCMVLSKCSGCSALYVTSKETEPFGRIGSPE